MYAIAIKKIKMISCENGSTFQGRGSIIFRKKFKYIFPFLSISILISAIAAQQLSTAPATSMSVAILYTTNFRYTPVRRRIALHKYISTPLYMYVDMCRQSRNVKCQSHKRRCYTFAQTLSTYLMTKVLITASNICPPSSKAAHLNGP